MQTSPEIQNRGISGSTKRADVLQKLKKKENTSLLVKILLSDQDVGDVYLAGKKPIQMFITVGSD